MHQCGTIHPIPAFSYPAKHNNVNHLEYPLINSTPLASSPEQCLLTQGGRLQQESFWRRFTSSTQAYRCARISPIHPLLAAPSHQPAWLRPPCLGITAEAVWQEEWNQPTIKNHLLVTDPTATPPHPAPICCANTGHSHPFPHWPRVLYSKSVKMGSCREPGLHCGRCSPINAS